MQCCTACGKTLPFAEFYRRSEGRLHRWCKSCYRARALARHRENSESINAKRRAAYRDNPTPAIERAKRWQRENPEAVYRKTRKWQQANPDKVRDSVNRRRARVRSAEFEKIDRARVFERDGGRCHICGKRVARGGFELDHLVPISKGGSHTYGNVRVAHKACNRRRSDGVLPAQLLLIG